MSFTNALQVSIFIVASVLLGIAIWTAISVWLLSTGLQGWFGPMDVSIVKSVTYGMVIGASHGLISALMILWRKSDSFGSCIISSMIAAEVFLVIAFTVFFCFYYWNQPANKGNSQNLYNLKALLEVITFTIFSGVFYYILFSIIFLIPSAAIGTTDRLFMKFLFGQE